MQRSGRCPARIVVRNRGYEGTRVVNYAQWRSKADFEAMLQSDRSRPHLAKAAALAEEFDPILCEVAEAISEGH
jgi:hypothetical protein